MSCGDGRVYVKWNGAEHVVRCGDNFGVGAPGNLGHGLHWWNTRQGQPWQRDIEAHVEAWMLKYAHVPDTELDGYIRAETSAVWAAWPA